MNLQLAQQPFNGTNLEDLILNNEPRSPTKFLLDISGSMNSNGRIHQLNKGLALLLNNIAADSLAVKRCEVAIITFGSTATLIQDFATVDQITPPVLSASGSTHMGEAMELALKTIEDRQKSYAAARRKSYKPNLVLISDGGPTDNWQAPAAKIGQLHAAGKLFFYPVGVDGADTAMLSSVSTQPALHIESGDLLPLLKFISDSMRAGSQREIADQTGFGQPNL